MVTAEQLETIIKVATRVHRKYVFGYHDPEDILQQAITEGIELLEKWDQKQPLENFLAVCIPNRLKNYKRKHYFRLDVSEDNKKRQESNITKKKLMEVSELFDFDLITECDVIDRLSYDEIISKLLSEMPPHIKADFKRLMNDVKVPKPRRDQVCEYIRSVLDEIG